MERVDLIGLTRYAVDTLGSVYSASDPRCPDYSGSTLMRVWKKASWNPDNASIVVAVVGEAPEDELIDFVLGGLTDVGWCDDDSEPEDFDIEKFVAE